MPQCCRARSLGIATFQCPLRTQASGVAPLVGRFTGRVRSLLAGPQGRWGAEGSRGTAFTNSGIPAFSPRLRGCVPWQKFLLFSPSCQVRGTLEVSTAWEEKALEGWRDGVMAPALNWERERPRGREFGLCWLLAVILGMLQPSWTLSLLSIQFGGGGQGYTSTPTP